jgi:hypothetical protein
VLVVLILAGQLTTGTCVSFTLMVNVHVVVLPEASVAVEVTVVVPIGKKLPVTALVVMVAPGQLSLNVDAVKLTTAPHWLASLDTVMFEGQLITGACVSFTVTVKLQLVMLPDASVAV